MKLTNPKHLFYTFHYWASERDREARRKSIPDAISLHPSNFGLGLHFTAQKSDLLLLNSGPKSVSNQLQNQPIISRKKGCPGPINRPRSSSKTAQKISACGRNQVITEPPFHSVPIFSKLHLFFEKRGMYIIATVVLSVSVLVWAYRAIQPPPPKICGSPNGPPVTSPRIRLRDGRYLAYRERGVPKEKSKYKIIVVHGADNSKDMVLAASQELIDELGIYFLSFDRAGYGESNPNPKRSVESEALDIQELADQLQLGNTFYVLGNSMGGYPTWGCLKYIPHRLAGAALVAPVVNYWCPSFPSNLSREVYRKHLLRDQWSLWIAHHIPQLLYWWMTQKWFPTLSLVEDDSKIYSTKDIALIEKMSGIFNTNPTKIRQQGLFESLHRDLMVGFGSWEFDPMHLINPFPQNSSNVHIWQGYEDRLVPAQLQRYVSRSLPWIQYHEVPDGGHSIVYDTVVFESILRALLH